MTTSEIKFDLQQEQDLKTVTEAFTEIAAQKMQRIRGGIEKNRHFLDELTRVYQSVKLTARLKKIHLKTKPKAKLAVLISSNFHFYGQVEHPVMESFSNLKGCELLVIGHTGVEYFRQKGNTVFNEFIIDKDLPNQKELTKLKEIINQYVGVYVYFSKMIRLTSHKIQVLDVNQTIPEDNNITQLDYILEPEVQTMVDFFETQIGGILVGQAFLEAELSRTAGRLLAMDQASSKTDELIKQIRKDLGLQLKHQFDKQLLEMINITSINYEQK